MVPVLLVLVLAAPSVDYQVQRGDTLGSIALNFYGDAARWPAIRSANPHIDPRRLQPGQIVRVPVDPGPPAGTAPGAASIAAAALGYLIADVLLIWAIAGALGLKPATVGQAARTSAAILLGQIALAGSFAVLAAIAWVAFAWAGTRLGLPAPGQLLEGWIGALGIRVGAAAAAVALGVAIPSWGFRQTFPSARGRWLPAALSTAGAKALLAWVLLFPG
ncbi:MAG: LysM peptidoglycan-binding domain-containing protein [Planctomycetes bacterium]|nr:LysM peptidoglycan-binding domain-containing protein [Planctomycetota bacterium]